MPDYGKVKNLINEILKADESLGDLVTDESIKSQIKEAFDLCIKENAKIALSAVDVVEINAGSLSVPIQKLRDGGYNNVYDIYHSSARDLSNIRGIGPDTASKIRKVAVDMAEKVFENSAVNIDADHRTEAQNRLLKSVYIYRKSKDIISRAVVLDDKYHNDIINACENAKPMTGMLSFVFAGKEKKNIANESFAFLESLEKGDYLREVKSLVLEYKLLLNNAEKEYFDDFAVHSADYYAFLEEYAPEKLKKVTAEGFGEDFIEEIQAIEPDLSMLKATLRSYQKFGVQYILKQKSVLLGDEMGLGKTVEAIGSMAALGADSQNTHFMVVCPASVLINWSREVALHSFLNPIVIHGNDETALNNWINNGGVAVTTYESISRWELPTGFKFAELVVDEAHYVKNPNAKRTQSLLKIREHTDRVLFMTGTPLENRVDEMCFLVNCLNPSVAGEIKNYTFLKDAKEFREKLAPVYLRRTKESVLKELPEITESKEWCSLGKEEKKAYAQVTLERNFMQMRQVSWHVDLENSSKAQRLLELCEEAKEEKRKIIVFSFFLKTIEKLQYLLSDRCFGPITGAMPAEKRQEVVDAFSKGPEGSILLSQIQAGGTGLNIQAASVIIFCEPQIKPSIENQALSRAYRMGQVRNVLVYRLLADDTIDEDIMDILYTKTQIFENFADESVVGEESMAITDQTCGKIIDKEIKKFENIQVVAQN